MLSINIQEFLKTGHLLDLKQIETEESAKNLLGEPEFVDDYEENGKYLFYDFLRLYYYKNSLSEIAFLFRNSKKKFNVKIEEESFTIKRKMRLATLLLLLNQLNIEWRIKHEYSKWEYILIELQSKVVICYLLDDRKLERLSIKIDNCQAVNYYD